MPKKKKNKDFSFLKMSIPEYLDSLKTPKSLLEEAKNLDKISHHYRLDLLYAEWIHRAMQKDFYDAIEQSSPKLVDGYLEMENRHNIIIDRLKRGWKQAVKLSTIDISAEILGGWSNTTIHIDIYASEEEIRQGVKKALSELLLKRTFLKSKEPQNFMKEIPIKQGRDVKKYVNGIQSALDWYDKYKDKDNCLIVAEEYGEEATRDDIVYNRKKNMVYERQRQAETCLQAAKSGNFPPSSLTEARTKRPRKKSK